MFSFDEDQLIRSIGTMETWTLIASASFEPRFARASRLLNQSGLAPTYARFLFPIDNGSRFETECLERQTRNFSELVAEIDWQIGEPERFPLVGGRHWPAVMEVFRAALQDCHGVVLDITTMPKICFLPLVAWLLDSADCEYLMVTYTEAGSYARASISTEPTTPSIIPPYDHLASGRVPAAWIPILGFVPVALTTIYEAFVDSLDVEDRVFPMIGLPAIELGFLERAVADGARGILETLRDPVGGKDHFFYAAAFDPFETRDAIIRLIDGLSKDISVLGSPLGPKPMALGMALAALERRMTVVTAQPRTYHPDYSDDHGLTRGYLLKYDGERTYV